MKSASDKIKALIYAHERYSNSFTRIQCAFSIEWERKGKRINTLGKEMEIGRHLNSTVEKIIKIAQEPIAQELGNAKGRTAFLEVSKQEAVDGY